MTTWMDDDLVAIAGVIAAGWDDARWPVASPRRKFDEPVQGTDPEEAAWMRWLLNYATVNQPAFQPTAVPLREGTVEIQFWMQPGAGALASDMRKAAADLFAGTVADTDRMVYFPPKPVMYGSLTWMTKQVWWVEGLMVPFRGT